MQHPIPNTFGFDVKARHFIQFNSEEELPGLLSQFPAHDLENRLWIVGQGSNLLFLKDYDGIILHSDIRGIDILPGTDADIRVGSGVIWDDFVAWTVGNGFYGAENLSAVPGEVGAAAVQNIGAYGVEVGDLILEVHGWDIPGRCFRTFKAGECGYGYRESIFKNPPLHNRFVVTSVTFRLSRTPRFNLDYGNLRSVLALSAPGCQPASGSACPAVPPPASDPGCPAVLPPGLTAAAVRNAVISIRRQKLPDPRDLGNAGSFFKNPVIPLAQFQTLQQQYPLIPHYPAGPGLVKVPAAWLIEQCGWKGRTVNGAAVYEKQPLVLVNRGNARPADIVRLSQDIIASIGAKFNITVSPEVNFVE